MLCIAPAKAFCISGLLILASVCMMVNTPLGLLVKALMLASFLQRSSINLDAFNTIDWSWWDSSCNISGSALAVNSVLL
jgi:hypothetical protein